MNNYIKTIINGLKAWTSSRIRGSRGNWDQNDPNADDYIKHRPFYSEQKIEKKVILSGGSSFSNELTEPLIVGKTYTVTWNDVEYNCVARMYDGYVMLGNNAVYEYDGGIDTDSGEPFALESQDGNLSCYAYPREDGDFTVSISYMRKEEVVKKIDKKYLPSTLPEVTYDDDGAFLRVVDGAWAVMTLPNAEEASF